MVNPCAYCRYVRDVPELETVDLPGVEILAADVTIHGRGSPPGGDRYSIADLRSIADAHRELASELRPPAKIGHDDYGPAVGYLENVRVSGTKLLADVKDVPRRFAELVNARAYHARSVELSRVTSQRTGARYPLVVSALAWLGAKMPAVRTLDDVHALYESNVDLVLVRAYESQFEPSMAADALIENAVETGSIAVGSEGNWRRLFEADANAAASLLEGQAPTLHRRMENRRVLLNAAPGCSEELLRAHEADLAARLFVTIEELV